MIWYQIVGLAFCVSSIWWNLNHMILSLKLDNPGRSAERVFVYLFVTSVFLFFTIILAVSIVVSTYKIVTD